MRSSSQTSTHMFRNVQYMRQDADTRELVDTLAALSILVLIEYLAVHSSATKDELDPIELNLYSTI